MNLKKIIEKIGSVMEERRKRKMEEVRDRLNTVIFEIVEVERSRNPDQYYLHRLKKDYNGLLRKAGRMGVCVPNYPGDMDYNLRRLI